MKNHKILTSYDKQKLIVWDVSGVWFGPSKLELKKNGNQIVKSCRTKLIESGMCGSFLVQNQRFGP